MRLFWPLHVRRLVEHRLRAALTLAGIVAAVALLVAVLCLSTAITESVARSAEVAGPADLQVTGITDTGLDGSMVAAVAATPGVSDAVPFVRAVVAVSGRPAVLVGLDHRAAALTGGRATPEAELLSAFAAGGAGPDGVVLARGLARRTGAGPGTFVSVSAGTTVTRVAVLAVVDDGALPGGATALAALPRAQRLAGRPDRVDGVAVQVAPGSSAEAVERRLVRALDGRAVVASTRLLARQAAQAAAALRTGLLTVSAMAVLVGGFIVFNTVSMTALERRRELATLRALGARRRPLLAGFVAAAALVGLAGAGLGTLLGAVAARQLVDGLPSRIASGFGAQATFVLPRSTIAVALVVGTALAAGAALVPGREAVRVAPVEAMRPAGLLEAAPRTPRARGLTGPAGLAAVAAAIVLPSVAGRRAALPAIVLFWGGGLAAELGFAGALGRAAALLAARLRSAGRLAAAALSGAPRRVVVTAAAVAASVALVAAQTGAERNVERALRETFGPLERTDVVVTTEDPGTPATGQTLPASLAARLAGVTGVTRTSRGHDAYATLGTDRVRLRGVERGSTLPVWRLAPAAARHEVLRGTGLVLTARLAHRHEVGAGDSFTLPTPTGPRTLRVAAVVDTFTLSAGDIVVALPALHDWFGRPGVTRVEMTFDDDADPQAVRREIEGLLADGPVATRVLTGRQAAAETAAPFRQVAATFDAIELVIVLAAALAVFNTMTISVVQRRRELGLLRAIGAGRRRLRRCVLAEGGAIGAIGAAVGLVLGAGGHYLVVLGTRQVGGLPVAYRFETLPLVLAAAGALAVTVLGTLGPAWRAGRVDVLEAVGYD